MIHGVHVLKDNFRIHYGTLYNLISIKLDKFQKSKFSLAETRIFLDFNAILVNMALVDENFEKELAKEREKV